MLVDIMRVPGCIVWLLITGYCQWAVAYTQN